MQESQPQMLGNSLGTELFRSLEGQVDGGEAAGEQGGPWEEFSEKGAHFVHREIQVLAKAMEGSGTEAVN